MASPPQNSNALLDRFTPQGIFPPFASVSIPGRFLQIPQHIRPFLDTTHEPIEGGFVPNLKEPRDDVHVARHYYYRLGRLPPVCHPATNRILSTYSGVELKPYVSFSGHQFDEYIFHAVRMGRKLMFRVEKQHTLMSYRYPRGYESTRCRFAKCPVDGTIRPGQFRVCISEFLDPRNEILDPYHNAGYTHLYCLEKFCNLPSLLTETQTAFFPAVGLAKELSFPPALNPAEGEACLRWAHEARQSWMEFKSTYPIAEARPRYIPSTHERLYYRLDQIHEAQKVSHKAQHRDRYGPQVYTYTQGRPNPAPEPAPKRLRTSPPGISIPASIHRSGPQVFVGGARLPYQSRPPTSHPQTYNNNLPIVASLPTSPGQILAGLAENAPTQLPANGHEGPGSGVDYSPEEIAALLSQDFSGVLESALEEFPWEFPWDEPTAPPAAGSQEGTGPEQSVQPKQAHGPEEAPQPVQDPEPGQSDLQVATVKVPLLTAGRRRSRRSSAPPVLSAQNAKIRKSSKASRRSSKRKYALGDRA